MMIRAFSHDPADPDDDRAYDVVTVSIYDDERDEDWQSRATVSISPEEAKRLAHDLLNAASQAAS